MTARDEHAVRVELLQTERARPVREIPPAPLKPVTPTRAKRNREVLEAALEGVADEPDGAA